MRLVCLHYQVLEREKAKAGEYEEEGKREKETEQSVFLRI